VKFYLKQGIQTKNREVLKEATDKARAAHLEVAEKELVAQATEMLRTLDAQHLIKFFLDSATKMKDDQALDEALSKAKTLNMGADVKEVAEAQKVHAELKAKAAKKGLGSKLIGAFRKEKKFELFGGKLTEAIKRSDRDVPKVCYKCIEFLEAKGLKEPGLFRIPGNKDVMDGLKGDFEEEIDVKLEDVHDTAGVLKMYIRTLAEPLIPFNNYESFVRIGQNTEGTDPHRVEEMTACVSKLPKENFGLLRYLVRFLYLVSSHSSVNKMTVDNIAIVFAPNLLRPAVETPESMLMEMPASISVISTLIDKYQVIFGDDDKSSAATATALATAASTTTPEGAASTAATATSAASAPAVAK